MAAKTKTETITVTALVDLYEAGSRYAKGDTFETTPARAEALGDAVSPDAPKP